MSMCLAIPGKVLSIQNDKCTVDYDGVSRIVDISLLSGVQVGMWLLVHAGFAIQIVDEQTARDAYGLLDEVDRRGLQ